MTQHMAASTNKYLIVVTGPTAVGKTGLSIQMARHFDTAILSADSRQFYREMTIGTAKPSPQELAMAPHHMVGFLSIAQAYDVKQFEEDALNTLKQLFSRHKLVIATGGSGLYIKTLCEGIDEMPDIAPEIRRKWNQRLKTEGLEALAGILQEVDPVYYAEADIQNPRRVLRALEMHEATGIPFSRFRTQIGNKIAAERPFRVIKIGISREREELYERINQRVDTMLEQGLEQEVIELYSHRQLNALQTVGYQEFFPYFEGEYSLKEAIRLIKRNTRHFAKRQMTWFRRDQDIHWFNLSANTETTVLPQILALINDKIKEHESA